MIFRRATLKDLKDILIIEDDSFPLGIKESKELYTDRIQVFPEGNTICEINGKCVGCICTEIWQVRHYFYKELFMEENSINRLHSPYGNTLYISTFALLKNYRGKGIGKALFEEHIKHVTKSFPKISKQLLVVGEPWKPAQTTYKKHGFKPVPYIILQGYFEPKEKEPFDGIVMWKNLS